MTLCYCVPNDDVEKGLVSALKALWTMSTHVSLTVSTPVTFLGMEIEMEKDGSIIVHQQTFIRQLLAKHGIDQTSKPMATIQMPNPAPDDRAPDEKELRELQAYAGEFNWLATRTRCDLSYVTSVIASAATHYAAWTLALCKKVLRYICGTATTGLRFPVTGELTTMATWSDAGFAGISTKSQTGVLVTWGGAVVTWRSSRQSCVALSTCEAEVSAAAMGFQIMEGLKCLVEEWGVRLDTPILLVDNKSAITVAENGGTWRTRYFAVRAARLQQEHQVGNVQLRYCKTAEMAADGLTKFGTQQMVETLRKCMWGDLPVIPEKMCRRHE